VSIKREGTENYLLNGIIEGADLSVNVGGTFETSATSLIDITNAGGVDVNIIAGGDITTGGAIISEAGSIVLSAGGNYLNRSTSVVSGHSVSVTGARINNHGALRGNKLV